MVFCSSFALYISFYTYFFFQVAQMAHFETFLKSYFVFFKKVVPSTSCFFRSYKKGLKKSIFLSHLSHFLDIGFSGKNNFFSKTIPLYNFEKMRKIRVSQKFFRFSPIFNFRFVSSTHYIEKTQVVKVVSSAYGGNPYKK